MEFTEFYNQKDNDDYKITNTVSKFKDSYQWALGKITEYARSLFTKDKGSVLYAENKTTGDYVKLSLSSDPFISYPSQSREDCIENLQSRNAYLNVVLNIYSGNSRTKTEKLVNTCESTLCEIPFMGNEGTFIRRGEEYVLATLESGGKFINPGMLLAAVYKNKIASLAENFDAYVNSSKRLNLNSVNELLGMKNIKSITKDVYNLVSFRFCQNDNNDVGRAKLLNQVVRQNTKVVDKYYSESSRKNQNTSNADLLESVDLSLSGYVDFQDLPEGAKNSTFYQLCAATDFEKDNNGDYTGNLTAPYYTIENGKVNRDHVVFINNKQTKELSKDSVVPYKGKIGKNSKYIQASIYNVQSLTSCLHAFSNNNDPNRALMADLHENAAVCIEKPDMPMVQTGCEKTVASLVGHISYAPVDGTVVKAEKGIIVIKDKDDVEHKIKYLDRFKNNGKFLMSSHLKVKVGDKVSKDQIIADGPSTRNGYFANGVNARVAMIENGTYEDNFYVRRGFAQEKFVCEIGKKEIIRVKGNIEDIRGIKTGEDGSQAIVKKGDIVTGSDSLVTLVDNKGNDIEHKLSDKEHIKYTVSDVKLISQSDLENVSGDTVSNFKIDLYNRHLPTDGDKISNRHGNKGTMILIDDDKMPCDKDGKPVDIIMSGISMNKRLNMGQIYETMAGELASKIKKNITVPTYENNSSLSFLRKIAYENGLDDSIFTTQLYDGETKLPYERPSVVGYQYIVLHPHLSNDEFTSRSLGNERSYDKLTGKGIATREETKPVSLSKMGIDALRSAGSFGEDLIREMEKQSFKNSSKELYLNITDGKGKTSERIPDMYRIGLKNALSEMGMMVRQRIVREEEKTHKRS